MSMAPGNRDSQAYTVRHLEKFLFVDLRPDAEYTMETFKSLVRGQTVSSALLLLLTRAKSDVTYRFVIRQRVQSRYVVRMFNVPQKMVS